MTKKEKERLHSDKCSVEITEYRSARRGIETRYIIGFSLDAREFLVLNRILATASLEGGERSDLAAYLNNALFRADIKL